MNVAFQIEVLSNSDGKREIISVECDPTVDEAGDTLAAQELGEGCWEFRIVVPDDFDETQAVFRKFSRYGLSPQTVLDACYVALEAAT
jgi:transposase-like protein